MNSNPEEASAEMDDNFKISSAHLGDVSWSSNAMKGFMSKICSDPELATFESLLYVRNNHPKFNSWPTKPHMTMTELLNEIVLDRKKY